MVAHTSKHSRLRVHAVPLAALSAAGLLAAIVYAVTSGVSTTAALTRPAVKLEPVSYAVSRIVPNQPESVEAAGVRSDPTQTQPQVDVSVEGGIVRYGLRVLELGALHRVLDVPQ